MLTWLQIRWVMLLRKEMTMRYDCAVPFQMLLTGQEYRGLCVHLLSLGSSQPSMTR